MSRLPGILADIERRLGRAVAERLGREFAGQRLEIPSLSAQQRVWRDERILLEFNGRNHRELARKWGLTVRRVRQLLERKGARKN